MSTILTTTLIISAITSILAAILTAADRTVGNYGEVKLTINNEKTYTVEGGTSLLSTLRNEKIFIPSACGGKGSCGYCKVVVTEGGGPVLATELPLLTKEELAKNMRLSCQCKLKQDIKIEIPEELFNVKEYASTVVKMEKVTPTIKYLRFDLGDEEINFRPGQYVQLKAPAYEGNDEEVYRAYSVASSVNDKHAIELLIGYTGGIATTYVHQHLNVGDNVHINGPYGDFYYHEDDNGPIILAGAGTGMAPILSILKYMAENNINRKTIFFFGAKTMSDLFMLEQIKYFEEKLPAFKFIATLSREESPDWNGDRGRVPDSIIKHVENGENYSAYLCGSPAMIDSIIKSLEEKNVPLNKIYYDKF
ncbi:NADH:ubiquinone reductase (Na(+)-transporting) subunit F [Sedimentibacter saalensis]|jgi:Na+-transporting NADH:ubiquinone oxidoreductase subunit F|uniref:NADH:ubiquinone reductase (Na(+)-transporting) subunit F n=1 Tax=Sedimentibacter saalensis TaxID=130788 RepID=UPI0028996EDE|nr:2Fe-2S iron-sulfur cluster binding domain-containing protein [Sedimentibacter saalensis]